MMQSPATAGQLELKADYADAHNNLGTALWDHWKLEEAVGCFRRALELKPDYAEAHNNLGNAFKDQGKLDDAIACYRRALELQPDYAEAHSNLGDAFKDQGKRDDAVACYRQALEWKPDCTAHFGVAWGLDARHAYDEASEHLRQANALAAAEWRLRGRDYDAGAHTRFVDRLLAAFTPAFFDRVSGFGVDSRRPIFVFGLPRSGTTLIEQVLASHSQVFGAGEMGLGEQSFLHFSDGPAIDAAGIQRQAKSHLDKLWQLNADARHVVDKMPDNYLYLGLLAALFPQAKFIHIRRDLRDIAVSCWMTNFRNLLWTNDADHIAARFQDYVRVMDYWRKVLPVPLLEVNYEETVANLEGEARRLLAWCGLEWEPACLAFHENKRRVRTASSWQVRQSIYTHSVARWKNYEKALGELFAKLPQQPKKTRLCVTEPLVPRLRCSFPQHGVEPLRFVLANRQP